MRRTDYFYCSNGSQAGGQEKCRFFPNFLCCQLSQLYITTGFADISKVIFITKELFSNLTKYECLFHNFNTKDQGIKIEWPPCMDVVEVEVEVKVSSWYEGVRWEDGREREEAVQIRWLKISDPVESCLSLDLRLYRGHDWNITLSYLAMLSHTTY